MTEAPLAFAEPRDWEEWLAKNYQNAAGVWLRLYKKGTGIPSITHPEALDVALCYGWIDAQRKAADAESYLQRFVPRGKRSLWSQINQGHVQRLIAAGRMQPPGMAEIDRAKADGRWQAAYEPQSRATVPDDLQAALDANEKAKNFFATLSSQNRFAVLFRIQTAKKPETRARKIEQFIEMLAQGRTLY